jgi:hypothetical protein
MSQIYGLLNVEDYKADQIFINTLGQSIVYDAVQQEIDRINSELNLAMGVFVGETTEDHTRRYKLSGGGFMQPRSRLARPAEVKATGSWDVAFPLFDFGDAVATDTISVAYMSIRDLNVHLDSLQARAGNTVRREILRSLFSNVDFNFQDEHKGTLAVKPLANGDATLYPPVTAADEEATENHYIVTGYAAADISNTNDPFRTLSKELNEHFDGSDIAVFFNSAQTSKITTLADFEDIFDAHIDPGANANEVIGLPTAMPGKIKGRHQEGAWGIEWDRIPAGYLVAIALDAPQPVVERVDPASIGLPRGLAMVARDERFPLETSYYMMRRGFGVGNRLNGVVYQCKASGTYDIPTAYAR